MLNIVVPMAGLGSRFVSAGYLKPKPFIDVNGKPMIWRVLDNLQSPNTKFILLARREHLLAEPNIVSDILKHFNATFVTVDGVTEGAACTVLHALDLINNDERLVIANSDQFVQFTIQKFIDDMVQRELDGSILAFRDHERNPKWSFAKTQEDGLVVEVREKQAISDIATVGIYAFRRGKDFVNSAIDMIVKNDRVNNEFYVCPTYNYAIKRKMKIGVFEIAHSAMHGIGTPEDLALFLKKGIL